MDATNKLEPLLDTMAQQVAAKLFRTYGEYVEQNDLYQECALWALTGRDKSRINQIRQKYGTEWAPVARNAMENAVSEYCRRQLHHRFPAESMEPNFAQAQEAFAELPYGDRWLVEQVWVHKRSQRDIANELGVSQPRISQRWDAIIHKLRTGHLVTELQSEMPEGYEVA